MDYHKVNDMVSPTVLNILLFTDFISHRTNGIRQSTDGTPLSKDVIS